MARSNFAVEVGLDLNAENGTVQASILQGSAVPGSAAQENNAPVGSIYLRTTGEFYQKVTAGSGTDKWSLVTSASLFTFRQEKVKTLTNDAYPGDGSTVSSFSDNNGAFAAVNNTTFTAGDYIIFDADGTAVLANVSATSGSNITVTTVGVVAMVTNNVLLVQKYLPDVAGQENAALVIYNGTIVSKLADVDWSFATGINLSSGYTPGTGNPVAGDSVEAAIQKVDGNVDSIDTREGLAQGATNFGTITAAGDYPLSSNSTAKNLFQEIENRIDRYKKQAAVTTIVTLDSVLVDEVQSVEWIVSASLDSAPARVQSQHITAIHDGTPSADAVSIDPTVYGKVKLGAAFTVNYTIDLSGVGAAQVLRLRVDAPAAVSVRAYRNETRF